MASKPSEAATVLLNTVPDLVHLPRPDPDTTCFRCEFRGYTPYQSAVVEWQAMTGPTEGDSGGRHSFELGLNTGMDKIGSIYLAFKLPGVPSRNAFGVPGMVPHNPLAGLFALDRVELFLGSTRLSVWTPLGILAWAHATYDQERLCRLYAMYAGEPAAEPGLLDAIVPIPFWCGRSVDDMLPARALHEVYGFQTLQLTVWFRRDIGLDNASTTAYARVFCDTDIYTKLESDDCVQRIREQPSLVIIADAMQEHASDTSVSNSQQRHMTITFDNLVRPVNMIAWTWWRPALYPPLLPYDDLYPLLGTQQQTLDLGPRVIERDVGLRARQFGLHSGRNQAIGAVDTLILEQTVGTRTYANTFSYYMLGYASGALRPDEVAGGQHGGNLYTPHIEKDVDKPLRLLVNLDETLPLPSEYDLELIGFSLVTSLITIAKTEDGSVRVSVK
jgi:hypothetical protein